MPSDQEPTSTSSGLTLLVGVIAGAQASYRRMTAAQLIEALERRTDRIVVVDVVDAPTVDDGLVPAEDLDTRSS